MNIASLRTEERILHAEVQIDFFLILAGLYSIFWLLDDAAGNTLGRDRYYWNPNTVQHGSKRFELLQNGKLLVIAFFLGNAAWVYFFGPMFTD